MTRPDGSITRPPILARFIVCCARQATTADIASAIIRGVYTSLLLVLRTSGRQAAMETEGGGRSKRKSSPVSELCRCEQFAFSGWAMTRGRSAVRCGRVAATVALARAGAAVQSAAQDA